MLGCCKNVKITEHQAYIEIDTYRYCITMVYCKNCGSLKATTNVKEIKDGN